MREYLKKMVREKIMYFICFWSDQEGQKAMKRKMDNARLSSSKSVLRCQFSFANGESNSPNTSFKIEWPLVQNVPI